MKFYYIDFNHDVIFSSKRQNLFSHSKAFTCHVKELKIKNKIQMKSSAIESEKRIIRKILNVNKL